MRDAHHMSDHLSVDTSDLISSDSEGEIEVRYIHLFYINYILSLHLPFFNISFFLPIKF